MRSDDPGDVRDSLVFSRKVFAFGGLWPEKFIPLLPETIATYVGFHLVTEICALLYLLKLSQILLIVSTMEFIFMLTMCLLTLLIRFNKYLPPLISEMKRDIEGNKLFKNNDEKRLYLRYNAISYNFGKYYLTLQTLIVLLMFFRPLVHVLTHLRGHDNMTQPYRSPLVNYLFFDYTHNAGYYFLMFLWESPAMYVSILHMAGVSFIVSLSLHLCGKYSILSYRIRNVPTKPPHHFQVNIKKVVEQHLKLTELTRNLNDGLHLMLLVEYLSCTSRMGLSISCIICFADVWIRFGGHYQLHYVRYECVRLVVFVFVRRRTTCFRAGTTKIPLIEQ
ncbi:uncharacterized protein LOC143174988 isoform X2 [Nomia melanderi]|uniref:uncharacterized protein LOC143174988 isoform X2 n=1 Tax=Nomia melanderi TaxID=2448451 RepID=UPI003FCECDCF